MVLLYTQNLHCKVYTAKFTPHGGQKETPVLSEPGLWLVFEVEYPEVSSDDEYEVEGES